MSNPSTFQNFNFSHLEERTRSIYILTMVDDENSTYDHLSTSAYFLLRMQQLFSGTKYNHIIIGINTGNRENLTCYETVLKSHVTKKKKSLYGYQQHTMQLHITEKQYKKLLEYLDYHAERKTKFNKDAYFWNFLPIISCCCSTKGSGLYCAQLVANALLHAEIIHHNVEKITTKQVSCLYYFGIGPEVKDVVKSIPPTHKINVGDLVSWIVHCNRGAYEYTSYNPNLYVKDFDHSMVNDPIEDCFID